MKSTIKKSTYKAIYRLLDAVSPVDYDCGTLCGAVCCTYGTEQSCDAKCNESSFLSKSSSQCDDNFDMGIYLLPGEEKLFTMEEDWIEWSTEYAEDYDFPDSWFGKIYFIRCSTPPVCHRSMRPLQCRFFPLAPHLNLDDELELILSPLDLPYSCPLIKDKIKLNDDFIKATYTVWKHLIRDPLIYDLVRMDSDDRIYDRIPLNVIAPVK